MNRTAFLAFGLICAVSSLSSPSRAVAQAASLLLDVNSDGREEADFTQVSRLTAAGGKVFFVSSTGAGGPLVWGSDGTPGGTTLLHQSCLGSCNRGPSFLGALGGVVLWTETPSGGSSRLWRSDGAPAGTYALASVPNELLLGSPGSPGNAAFLGDSLYFRACERANGACDLWRTDGTAAGTRAVPAGSGQIGWLQTVGDRLFYSAEADEAWELWTLTPSQPSPVRLHTFGSDLFFGPTTPAAAGGRLYFLADESDGEELWTSDGSVAGTKVLVRRPDSSRFGSWLKTVGRYVYFVADEQGTGYELWRSDGSAAGTVRLTFLASTSPFPSDASGLVAAAGSHTVFVVRDPEGRLQIWTTRGTPQTTAHLPLACDDCEPWFSTPLLESGGKVYFNVERDFSQELWVTDGTPSGTRPLDLPCGGSRCFVGSPSPWEGGILFALGRGTRDEIWFSDGTPAGTRLWGTHLRDFDPAGSPLEVVAAGGRDFFLAQGTDSAALCLREPGGGTRPVALVAESRPSSNPWLLQPVGDRLLFTARSKGYFDPELWATDGTPATTAALAIPGLDADNIGEIVRAGHLSYFVADRSFDVYDLWRTDGTAEGTFVVAHLQSWAPLAAGPGGLLFFDGGWIWRTDGTVAGTVKTGDVPEGHSIGQTQLGPEGLYLQLSHDFSRAELWITDGTNAGTRQLTHFGGTAPYDWRLEMVRLGDFNYFGGAGGIWRTDGTEAGTTKVIPSETPSRLTSFQGSLYYFTGLTGFSDVRLWKSDGSLAGTTQLALFPRQETGTDLRLVPSNGRLYFVLDDGTHGLELWSTDGTPAGTALVRDLWPGSEGSNPGEVTAAGGALYFSARDSAHGVELWRSDGTAAGTRLAQDIAPQAESSHVHQLTLAGDELYFVADDGIHGYEPWVLPLSGGTGCRASSTRLCLAAGRYAVESTWRDHQGNDGVGHAVALTADTGYFWFFDPSNVETVLKVLDGRGVNGHVWTFYGALSDVEYSLTVTDTESGLSHRYVNPPGQLASVADTRSFGPQGANLATAPAVTTKAVAGSSLVLTDRRVVARAATGACAPSSDRLCLNGGRYSVEVAWKDFSGNTGTGQGVGLTADTGYFWFFNAANVELVLKVLDGSAFNGHRWVFYGALSSVEYTVTVTDTETGEIKTYRNPSGNLASVADIEAF